MRYDEATITFIRDRRGAGKSPRTVKGDRLALSSLGSVLPPSIGVDKVSLDHLEEWVRGMVARDLGTGARRGMIVKASVFFKWCQRKGYRSDDPTVWLERPRLERSVPRALNDDRVHAAFLACRDLREELIISFMVMEGLRVAEVARLEEADVDLRDRVILVHGKGRKERMVALTEETEKLLKRYLAEHPLAGARRIVRQYDGNATSARRGLTSETVSRMVTRICWDAGIKTAPRDGVSAHAFRHTCLSDIYEETSDIRLVQEIAGHESISTTQMYVRRTSPARMREAMAGRHYRQ